MQVVTIQYDNLVVRNHARVGPVIRASKSSKCCIKCRGKEFFKDGERFRNTTYLRVVGDLRDQIAWISQVAIEKHVDAKVQHICVRAE